MLVFDGNVFMLFVFRRMVLETVGTQQVTQLPSIKDFTWRVDVAISTRYSPMYSN